jgi:hypothetical protein
MGSRMGLFEEIQHKNSNRNKGGVPSRVEEILKYELSEKDAADLLKALQDKGVPPMVIVSVLNNRNIPCSKSSIDRWRKRKGLYES